MSERAEWLARPPREQLAKRLKVIAWILTGAVLVLVGLMRRPELRIPLPEGWSFAFLPPVHAALNSLVAVALVVALVAIRKGRVRLHQRAMMSAMFLSVAFLLCYVAYHFTTPETIYGDLDGDGVLSDSEIAEAGPIRSVYLGLLLSHIALAGISLPCILLTFIAAWTNRFAAHRRLARWVFPLWLFVAVTGPICYWMLRPYY